MKLLSIIVQDLNCTVVIFGCIVTIEHKALKVDLMLSTPFSLWGTVS